MMNKKITILILCLAVMTVVSGCGKKLNESVNNNITDLDIQAETNDNQFDIENKEVIKEYEITQNENGWKIFKSNKCGFEISYPEGFKEYNHLYEDMSNIIFSIYNKKKKNKDYQFSKDGEMSIMIKKMTENIINLENWVKETFTEGKSHSSKLGDKFIKIDKKIFIDKNAFYVDLEYNKPIEGPPSLIKYLYFEDNGNKYQITASIPYKNKEMINTYYEIIKTFKFIK